MTDEQGGGCFLQWLLMSFIGAFVLGFAFSVAPVIDDSSPPVIDSVSGAPSIEIVFASAADATDDEIAAAAAIIERRLTALADDEQIGSPFTIAHTVTSGAITVIFPQAAMQPETGPPPMK